MPIVAVVLCDAQRHVELWVCVCVFPNYVSHPGSQLMKSGYISSAPGGPSTQLLCAVVLQRTSFEALHFTLCAMSVCM